MKDHARAPGGRSPYHYLPGLLVGLLALALYAGTAAPWLTWAHDGADGGDLIAAAMTGGVPHPSGYPTWSLLGRAYALLPLGNIARRFNLFSATAAAASVVLVYLTALAVLDRRTQEHDAAANGATQAGWRSPLIAAGVAAAFGAGRTLWSQATITEVYALHTLFFAACFYLALRNDWLASSVAVWGAWGLLFGLGLGVHLTLSLALPGFLLLAWPHLRLRRVAFWAGGALLGAAVYLYLPLAARGSPPVNWGDPVTWEGFWWLVSGSIYHHYVFGLPLDYLPARLGAWVRLWIENATLVGLALSLLGLASWPEGRGQLRALATVIIVALYTLYSVTYDTTDSYVYLLPTYVVGAVWMAVGVGEIADSLGRTGTSAARAGKVALAVVLVALSAWLMVDNWAELDLRGKGAAAEWVEATLEALPEGALLITGEDGQTFAMDYVRWVEGRRQDVPVIDGELWRYGWYRSQLAERRPELALEGLSLSEVISENVGQRPVYLATERRSVVERHGLEQEGHLWRVVAK